MLIRKTFFFISGMDKKKQLIFAESSKSNFYVRCTVTTALITSVSLLWRPWCAGHRMGEAGRGHLLDLWCQIVHPHHQYVLSSEYLNVNCRLYLLFRHSCKIRAVFPGSADIAKCDHVAIDITRTLRLNWHYLRSRTVKSTLGFVYSRVNRGQEENQGHQGTGVLQEKAYRDHRYEHRCQQVLHRLPLMRLFILPEKCNLPFLQGSPGKNGEPGSAVNAFWRSILNRFTSIKRSSYNIWLSALQGLRGPQGVAGPQGPAGHNVSPK